MPPHCPNRDCRFFRGDRRLWRFVKDGFFARRASPQCIQRYRCVSCRRHFSAQTFSATYWLKRPQLLERVLRHAVAGSGIRQMARALGVSPQAVLGQIARLGRHCLLFHVLHRPRGPLVEPIALDGFESFEFSQYHPTSYHVVVGQRSHFFYGFTESELRRKGTMTARQRVRRAELEANFGRPDPKSVEREVAGVLRLVAPGDTPIELHTDGHPAYPRAIRRLGSHRVAHHTISSRAARTARNPLFAINLLDMLIRHSCADHRRETIAYPKRRQGAIERLWNFLVWRNYGKSFSERHPGESPAMRLGLVDHLFTPAEILSRRLFPGRIEVPERWQDHYWRRTATRRIPRNRTHRLQYAF